MTALYGIKNCDSVKRARAWLNDQGHPHDFYDLRSGDLELQTIVRWIDMTSSDVLLNRRGTTWRNLDTVVKESVNKENIAELLRANPTLIKRPVLDYDDRIIVGFKPELYLTIFSH
jgi:Spx/MgsR family transcriptional regulator